MKFMKKLLAAATIIPAFAVISNSANATAMPNPTNNMDGRIQEVRNLASGLCYGYLLNEFSRFTSTTNHASALLVSLAEEFEKQQNYQDAAIFWVEAGNCYHSGIASNYHFWYYQPEQEIDHYANALRCLHFVPDSPVKDEISMQCNKLVGEVLNYFSDDSCVDSENDRLEKSKQGQVLENYRIKMHYDVSLDEALEKVREVDKKAMKSLFGRYEFLFN